MLLTTMSPGFPCWFELTSTAPERSRAFFAELFGWQMQDTDMGPMGVYTFLANGSGTVGALWGMPAEQRAAQIPSYWGVFFLVADCDRASAEAARLGATVVVPPMDIADYGRMAVITDPSGATCSLWQATGDASSGPGLAMFEPHAVGWVELATRDTGKARDFYTALFGWQTRETPIPLPGDHRYTHFSLGDTPFGGMLGMTAEWGEIPPHWALYFMVEDVDACVAKALSLGGSNPVSAFNAPGVGRIALIAEPTGAYSYVIAPDKRGS